MPGKRLAPNRKGEDIEPSMNASQLWQALTDECPKVLSRVAHQVGPRTGSARDLIEHLMDRKAHALMGDMKCGSIGNPYEQDLADFEHLVSRAEAISGIKGRRSWERS